MIENNITPVQEIFPNIFAKREDYAGYTTDEFSSGTKVRVYENMIMSQPSDQILLIGCSADSMM